ncbi:Non-reducing polyketide synthase pks27 [Lasiodiplodia theobromae]|uniref:Non-reducing polyketide synthase pks27 n=1 Tax=Lasiodiplodia theobromae TaxID=45133 RepID=A0A5N5DMW2_9PEZI|nr:Non-reducing polyketide synthase pks27 [Lasiodiplodia theobromae]
MAHNIQVLLFGDVTCDYHAGLRSLVARKDNPVLTSFFERVTFALRAEIGKLPFSDRDGFVKFTTFVELLTRLNNAKIRHHALEKALTCVHQFASFISHCAQPGTSYPDASSTRIVGLCTGLLTGAAVSCTQSLTELIPVAVQTVVLAFRTGLVVADVRDRIDMGQPDRSWSIMIPGLSGTAAAPYLDEFSRNMGLSSLNQPYVSAYADTGATISGPPDVLDQLIKSKKLPKSSSIKLRVHGPYHARHLYDVEDVDKILGAVDKESMGQKSRIPLFSASTSEVYTDSTLDSLLKIAVSEILITPLRLDKISKGLASHLTGASIARCDVLPVATLAAQALSTELKKAGIVDVRVDNSIMNRSGSSEPIEGNMGQSKLAIIGYSGRYPGAQSNEAFWNLLHEGRDVASKAPKTRWDINTHVDATGKKKNTSATPFGCWLEDPGLFDARFFNMSPREAPQVDPAQRLSLLTAYEALEKAGMVPDATPSTQRDRVGVFYGTTSNDWGETNSSQNIDTYYIPGSCRAFIPGRQNYYFKFSGPSYSVDTACSSSLAALHVACNALWRGDIDTAIAGGTNVTTNPDITAGLDRGHFLSRTGNCKTFDDDADGYCRGEGVVTLVVKRYEDAVADNDPIIAMILGAYTNHSAEAESITRPHVGAQRAIFEKVLTSAGADADSIGYVEMHGTGTQAGDAREMESVLATFADTNKARSEPLHIGSAKANVGHGESVSGVIALVKVLMMLEQNLIPPHVGIKTKINSKFPTDLKERNVHIATQPTPWPRPADKPRRALINNFSAAGGNSSVLVEDAPVVAKPGLGSDARSSHVVAISAKSKTALAANARALLDFIQEAKPDLASLGYTTTARRLHHPFRIVAHGSELADICTQLERKLAAVESVAAQKRSPSVAFAFTGQGSQYPGMGRELLRFQSFRKDLERLDVLCQKLGFERILPLVRAEGGDIAELPAATVQLASTCIQMAMARLWRSWGLQPAAVVGHSLGEYAALNVAGVLSDADTIMLTGTRATLLQQKCTQNTHAMLAVGASMEDVLKNDLGGCEYEVACNNGPREVVFSGTSANIEKMQEALSTTGFRLTRLRVPFAFHSSQVEPILPEFEKIAGSVEFHAPRVPVISPLLGEVVTEAGHFGAKYLSRHCRETVNFVDAMAKAKASLVSNDTIWVEVGPHPVLSGLLRSNMGSITALPTLQRNKDTWKVLSSSLSSLYDAGAAVNWNEFHRDFNSSVSVCRLPAYKWDLKNYWMQYVNDWSLYKGDALFLSGAGTQPLSTTSVQKVVQDTSDGTKATLIAESDLLREDLDPMVRGHRVNGVALCTPSVYADMALTMGDHLARKKPEWAAALVDVQHMDVQRPLVAKSKGSGVQLLRCRVDVDWATGRGACEFYSVTPDGKKLTKHAECQIAFVDADAALREQQDAAPAILQRIDGLRRSIESSPRVQKLNGNSGYKLVSSLASYDDDFKGVEEVVLDSAALEATAKVRFGKGEHKGAYFVNPHLIDNFGQPALFVMNANDEADLDKEVFVNHGWSSLHFYKPVSMDKAYVSYVKMSGPKEDGMYSGDMIVFEGTEVVAAFKGIKAQGVPRRLMDYIVHMRDDTKAGPPRGGTKQLTEQRTTALPVASVHAGATRVEISVEEPTATTTQSEGSSGGTASWSEALRIIGEESGVPVADLTDETSFADLGVDSLLSLLCASRFREELGLDYESTIFADCPTVKELRTFWTNGTSQQPAAPGAVPGGRDAILHSMFHDDPVESSSSSSAASESSFEVVPEQPTPAAIEPATSLLLQGNPAAPGTLKTLFLLPDGAGSSSSYASLPRIHPSVAVVGLNCPYMKRPDRYTCGIDPITSAYIAEIRRRQPRGPYSLGGWSVGGIFAYDVAQRLASAGEVVADLVLIDCPVPRGLDLLPTRYYEYCDAVGLLGEGPNGVKRAPPPWLVPHFEACVRSLHEHHAVPFDVEGRSTEVPKTSIVWACDAIDEHVQPRFERRPEDPEGLKFLTERRTDFGTCGWETLLPEDCFEVFRATGANHFSMMKGEHAKRLSEFIEIALIG